jgi:hypothetical protein
MGKATNSSSEEAAKAKRVKLETTRGADNAIAHRKEDNSSRNINAGGPAVMTAAAHGGASSATKCTTTAHRALK